jgi:hypothetical protein
VAVLVAMSALLFLAGSWGGGRWPSLVVRATLLMLLVPVPLVVADALVNHREHWVANLPDYGNMLRERDSRGDSMGPGGLLRPSVDCTARGAWLWQSVRWITDADGFRNRQPLAHPKPAGRLRILVLGDSFSSGYRIDQDATFPARLEQRLRGAGLDAEVRNSCTEDPVLTADYLARFGDAAQPDVVVQAFCIGNDFTEADYRLNVEPYFAWDDSATDPRKRIVGGNMTVDARLARAFRALEFPPECLTRGGPLPKPFPPLPDASLPPNAKPWANRWAVGRALRQAWVVHTSGGDHWPVDALTPAMLNSVGGEHPMDTSTGFGFFARQPIAEVRRSYATTGKVLGHLRDLCQALGARLVVVPIPQRFQVTADSWRLNAEAYGLRAACFDMDRPNQWMGTTCAQLGVDCVDPLPAMRTAATKGGGPLYQSSADMHWAARAADLTSGLVARWVLDQYSEGPRGH